MWFVNLFKHPIARSVIVGVLAILARELNDRR